MESGSGNVFADLGLPDAGEHLIKAGLVVKIDRTIRQRHLTQAAAAQLMGIDQPKVSAKGPVESLVIEEAEKPTEN
jgi:predicted XRE-type DNA-binding protein